MKTRIAADAVEIVVLLHPLVGDKTELMITAIAECRIPPSGFLFGHLTIAVFDAGNFVEIKMILLK